MSRFPRTFSDLYRGLVAVGAETGQLGGVLSRLADYLEARQVLRQKFTLALIYPALITIIALGVITTLLVYVVPQIVAVYQQSRQTLPFLTRALIASSDFLRATGWYWLGAIALLAIGATLLLRRERWRDRWHSLLLRLPVAGRVLSGLDTARFASTLSILTGSGAPLLRALDTAAGVVWARPMRRAADAVAAHVRGRCRWRARLPVSACFRPCSFTWSRMASKAGSCLPCSTAQRASRNWMSSGA
jgi:general secretion pathway protein F